MWLALTKSFTLAFEFVCYTIITQKECFVLFSHKKNNKNDCIFCNEVETTRAQSNSYVEKKKGDFFSSGLLFEVD